MKIELSKLQQKHFDSLKWLVSDSRRDGKTYLLAIVFIQKAISKQGEWVRPFDHYPEIHGLENLMNLIHGLLTDKENFTFDSEFKRDEFRIV